MGATVSRLYHGKQTVLVEEVDHEEEHTIDAMTENAEKEAAAHLAEDNQIEHDADAELEKLGRLVDTAEQIKEREDIDMWILRGETLDARLRWSSIQSRPLSPRHGERREVLDQMQSLGYTNKHRERRMVFQEIWKNHLAFHEIREPIPRHEKRHETLKMLAMHIHECRATLHKQSAEHAMENARAEEWESMTTLFQMAEYCLDPEEIGSHIGGATLTPSHVTFSFWGKCRQQLWFVVKQLGIDIHTEVHMMNGMQAGNNTEPVDSGM